MLILGASYATRGYTNSALSCQSAAFYLGLAALFLPLVEKVYNAVIHPISACCRGEFDPRNFFFAFIALLMAIPGAVITMLGLENAELDDAMGGTEEALRFAEESVDGIEGIGDQLEDLAAGLAELGSNVAGDLHWMSQAKRAEKQGKGGKRSWMGLMFRLRRPKTTKPTLKGEEEMPVEGELPAEGKEELGSQPERKHELPAEAAEQTGNLAYESVPPLAPAVTNALDKPYRLVDSDYLNLVTHSVDTSAGQDYSVPQRGSSMRTHFSSLDVAPDLQSLDKSLNTAPALEQGGRRSRRRSRASSAHPVDPAYQPRYVGSIYSNPVHDSTQLGEASGSAAGRRRSSAKVVKEHRSINVEPSEPLGMELITDDKGRIVTVSVTAGSRAEQAGIPVGARLVDVNGLSVRKMDFKEVSSLLASLSDSGKRHLTFSSAVASTRSKSQV